MLFRRARYVIRFRYVTVACTFDNGNNNSAHANRLRKITKFYVKRTAKRGFEKAKETKSERLTCPWNRTLPSSPLYTKNSPRHTWWPSAATAPARLRIRPRRAGTCNETIQKHERASRRDDYFLRNSTMALCRVGDRAASNRDRVWSSQ